MESYLKFLEQKVDKIIRDMAAVHILKKEIKLVKEENEVIKTLLFGVSNPKVLTCDLLPKSVSSRVDEGDYSNYTKGNVNQDIQKHGCLLKRMTELEKSQIQTDDFAKEID